MKAGIACPLKIQGRFCGSCNKTVVDFTKMDSHQIQEFLQENKNQSICGHINQTQLDSILVFGCSLVFNAIQPRSSSLAPYTILEI